MLAAFKEVLLPYLVYLTVLLAFVIGLTRRAEVPVFLYAVLAPLPTLWYPTQGLPLGKDTMDLLIVSALIGGWVRRPPGSPAAPQLKFVLLLIGVSYLAVWNVSLRYGLPIALTRDNPVLGNWKNYAMMMLLYVVVFNAIQTRQQVQTLTMIFISVLLFMVWRELSGFVAGESFSYGRRANGPFWIVGLNANHFGAFIAHYAVFALGMYAVDTHKWRRRLYLLTFAGSLYPLFYSYSRGAYVAVLAALLVLGLVRWRLLLVLLAIFMFTWTTVLPDSVVDRINTTESEDGDLEESAAMRLVVWDLAERLFKEHPGFGVGFDGFWYASDGLSLRNTHNYYLQTAAEQGLIGLLLLAALFFKGAKSGWRLYREGDSDFFKAMGLGSVVCVTAVMVTNVFGDRFSQLELGSYFFMLLGMVDRARQISQSESAAPPEGEAALAAPAHGAPSA
ncbi:MAG TPA: O-antigen ligase family protein [Ideonella sp.]|nr:O-antigen ligase family protein [Ideonella sp.]